MVIIIMAKKKSIRKFYFFRGYLDEGEHILEVAHRHVLVLKVDSAKASFFGLLIPGFLYWLFPQAIFFWVIWAIIGFGGLFYHFIDWYFDAWILTDMGIVDVERNGLFDFTSTRVDYHMIEGISYNINGVVRTLFNYGDIVVDKLGTRTSVMLKDAANPKKLERQVMKYQEKYVNSKSIRDHHALKDMLSEMIAYHVHNQKINKKK